MAIKQSFILYRRLILSWMMAKKYRPSSKGCFLKIENDSSQESSLRNSSQQKHVRPEGAAACRENVRRILGGPERHVVTSQGMRAGQQTHNIPLCLCEYFMKHDEASSPHWLCRHNLLYTLHNKMPPPLTICRPPNNAPWCQQSCTASSPVYRSKAQSLLFNDQQRQAGNMWPNDTPVASSPQPISSGTSKIFLLSGR